jgi:RNA polymerase sigma-32 factor
MSFPVRQLLETGSDGLSRRSRNAAGRSAVSQGLKQAPMLSRDDEFSLARRWRAERDAAASHVLARARRGRCSLGRRDRRPLPQLRAADERSRPGRQSRIDAGRDALRPGREVRFSTYAAWWMRSAIQDYILRNWSIVRTGATAAQKMLFFNLRRLRARIAGADGGPRTREAREKIALALKVSVADVEMIELRLGAADQSLNASIREGGEEDRQDLFVDARANPEELVIEMRDGAARPRWLNQAHRTPRRNRR